MKKRVLAMALAMTMVFSTTAFADDAIYVNVNGKAIVTDQPPIISNGRTMVPLRAVAEALGCQVEWDNTSKTATFVQGEVTAVVTVGENYITVGDGVYNSDLPIDTPAVIVNSRTMIPLRALSEGFGYSVEWDSKTKTVNIDLKSMEDNDTDKADEMAPVDTNYNLALKVSSYAEILKGITKIIDSVDYTNNTYANIKTQLDDISSKASSMTYDELISAFTKLKEIDQSLADIANDAGVSEYTADYINGVQSELNDIMSKKILGCHTSVWQSFVILCKNKR